jgi:uncharacterized protein (DUF4213/DUF364 family)
MQEPILHFFNKFKFDSSQIAQVVTGDCFTAVMLKNGNIGICGNTGHIVEPEMIDLNNPDTDIIEHRIILNAYYNAFLNYRNEYSIEKDVFEQIDFSVFKKIVMIGYFESTYTKFEKAGIDVSVFDTDKTDPKLVPLAQEMEYVRNADAIMMTGTTISNNTFQNLTENTKTGCQIFLTGPSAIMHPDMFVYKNIKTIMGSVFEPNDQRILESVAAGGCTKDFIKFGKKVVFEG